MHRLNRGITGSWWLVALNTYLTLSIAGIAIGQWVLYARPAWELHLATVCLAGMVVALALEIVLAYKQRALQAHKDPS